MAQLTIQQAFDLAVQHHQAGRLQEAERIYRQVIVHQPRHVDALHNLGVIAYQIGRKDDAVDLIRQALKLNPSLPNAHKNLGIALKDTGQLDEAIAAYRQGAALNPDTPDAHFDLGNILMERGQNDEAVGAYRRAIVLRPDYADAHNNLGNALKGKGQIDSAILAYRQAVVFNRSDPDIHSNLGNALAEKGNLEEAIAAWRQAIALAPDRPEALFNFGNMMKDRGQLDEAIAAYRQAIALRPDYADAHNNLGTVLKDKGDLIEAIACYQKVLAINPGLPEAHGNLAQTLLVRGEFERGWEEFEWRWKCKDRPSPPRNFAQPEWDGSPLEGRTLLLHTEQGFGDNLQFIRYLPLVAQRGGEIIVECYAELQRFFQQLNGRCRIVARGQALPNFDVHLPLLSLPRLFATNLTNIPKTIPYLHADAEETGRWQQRLAGYSAFTKIGLAWAGSPTHQNDRNRSILFAKLAPLIRMPGARFFSLQKGNQAARELIDWSAELKDFADTAALIANLDLVIAVDTAVVHLAGAMGKPVWTLLPFAADWRWLLEREDSPWYPSMRLFRQPALGDWDSVIKRVADELCRNPFARRL